ncbi:hypothetical protein OAC97_03205 [Flavobacteriaceae bacterium]|nr:hypothetical protein [Flavobacteriaceae bacterium]
MHKFLYFLVIILTVFSCDYTQKSTCSIEDLVPKNASVVLSINSLEGFQSAINNNALISKIGVFKSLKKALIPLDSLKSLSPLLVCITKEKSQVFTFITHQRNLSSTDTLLMPYITLDSILVASTSTAILESVKTQKSSEYSKLSKLQQSTNTFSVFCKTFPELKSIPLLNAQSVYFGFNVTPESIAMNGTVLDQKSQNKWFTLFENMEPQPQSLQTIIPAKSSLVNSFNYTDFEQLTRNIDSAGFDSKNSVFAKSFFSTTKEIGSFKISEGSGIALKSIDINATYEALSSFQNELSSFRSVPLFEFTEPSLFTDTFGPFLTPTNTTKFIIIEDYLVFSNFEKVLQLVISNYLNKNTLETFDAFETIQNALSDEASFQTYFDTQTLGTVLKELFGKTLNKKDLSPYKISALQLVKDDHIVHVNSILQKSKSKQSKTQISETFSLTLSNDILMDPVFVTNHRTKKKDILVQDIDHNLYLISNKGVILWKKKLKGAVLGKVEQVDLYRNGRLQLAFATPNKLYVIDRNGKNVDQFPLIFKDEITQPLAVFDYDKQRNYRFLITQNKNLLMYDSKGKSVKGFKYKAGQSVSSQPKHFRIRGKDYIVFSSGNQLKLLDRRGKNRVKVKEPIDFSGAAIYLYTSLFTTTNTKGDLVQVNTKGTVSRLSLGLDSKHDMTSSSKTLVTRSENTLTIKSNTVELEYGSYSPPSLFYLRDKIYISITDIQAQKIWLFDSQAKPFAGVPVFGTSAIDLANADADSSLEFVTKGDSNSLIMYQLY